MTRKRSLPLIAAAFLGFAVIVVFILGNSLLGGRDTSHFSRRAQHVIQETLHAAGFQNATVEVKLLRKIAHAVEFAALGAVFACFTIAARKRKGRWFLSFPLLCALLLALLDESLQTFTSRQSRVSDVLIDFAGTCVGFLPAFIPALREARKNRHHRDDDRDDDLDDEFDDEYEDDD